jgi:hypothetical protein
MAYAKPKYEKSGGGCLVQLIGLIALFFFPIGTLFGIGLFFAGSAMSRKWRCSSCGNPIADKYVSICPTCKIQFTEKAKWYQM